MHSQPMIKILIVDDYKPWQDFVCSMLETAQGVHVVYRAADALDGVRKAGRLQPDVILLDVGLPTMNGLDAALEIRRCAPKSRILFVSENRDAEIIQAAMATGAVGYIAKSNAANELVPTLKAIRCGLAHNGPHLVGTDGDGIYEEIIDVAVELMHSEFASIQELFPKRGTGGELHLLAFRGFTQEAAEFWDWVRADSNCTCGIALRDRCRVVAPDIANCDFLADTDHQKTYLQSGIRACQTTPLIASSGELVGMISTHWSTPHQTSEDDFRVFDILAREAADVVEFSRREDV